jgi:hypothetical protein
MNHLLSVATFVKNIPAERDTHKQVNGFVFIPLAIYFRASIIKSNQLMINIKIIYTHEAFRLRGVYAHFNINTSILMICFMERKEYFQNRWLKCESWTQIMHFTIYNNNAKSRSLSLVWCVGFFTSYLQRAHKNQIRRTYAIRGVLCHLHASVIFLCGKMTWTRSC